MKFKAVLLIAMVLAAMPFIGIGVTRALVSDGVASDAAAKAWIARKALREARSMCLDHPIAVLMTPALSIRRLTIEPGWDMRAGEQTPRVEREFKTLEDLSMQANRPALEPGPQSSFPHFEAELQKYGWFAIPTGLIMFRFDDSLGSADCVFER